MNSIRLLLTLMMAMASASAFGGNVPQIGNSRLTFGIQQQQPDVRGCGRMDYFCDGMEEAGCDCKLCHPDNCTAALGNQKMSFGLVILMLALAIFIPLMIAG